LFITALATSASAFLGSVRFSGFFFAVSSQKTGINDD
jgi:hypothetical protein